jgi:hypothetical protein
VTPAEKAAAFVADPDWQFADNPTDAIGYATMQAATHHEHGRAEQAQWWTRVGAALVRAADSPLIVRGAVLGGLVETYGVGVEAP